MRTYQIKDFVHDTMGGWGITILYLIILLIDIGMLIKIFLYITGITKEW